MWKFLNIYQHSVIAGVVVGVTVGSLVFFGEQPAYAGYGQGGYYGQATYYLQGAYYSQAGYYGQSTYYSQTGYYSQGTYYTQGGYYAQSSYGPGSAITYSFEYEPNGYCVRVTVVKQNVHPRTRIHSDGFNVPCDDIEISGRALQRSVELTY
jgi:hypothetical protein